MLTSETTSATGGRKFYAEQIELLGQRRTDELIDKHYHGDAVFVSFGKVVRGAQNLKQYFRDYVKMLGKLDLLSLDQFTETEDAIFFEATIRSSLEKRGSMMRSCCVTERQHTISRDSNSLRLEGDG